MLVLRRCGGYVICDVIRGVCKCVLCVAEWVQAVLVMLVRGHVSLGREPSKQGMNMEDILGIQCAADIRLTDV